MKDSDAPQSSILPLTRYVKKAPAMTEEEERDRTDAFREARTRSREALMLDVRLKDGTIESFDYGVPKRVTYTAKGLLILRFGRDTITVQGSNLQRVRQAVTEGRARFIQEGTEAEEGQKPEDAAHIERIEIVEWEGPS